MKHEFTVHEYRRAAISGTAYANIDAEKAGPWRANEDDALNDAAKLILRHGENTVIGLQRVIMAETRRDELNEAYERDV